MVVLHAATYIISVIVSLKPDCTPCSLVYSGVDGIGGSIGGSTSIKVYIGGRFNLYLYICTLMCVCELMPVSATALLNILVMLASLSSPNSNFHHQHHSNSRIRSPSLPNIQSPLNLHKRDFALPLFVFLCMGCCFW